MEGQKVIEEWLATQLGGRWSEIPVEVLSALVSRPELALRLMLIHAVQELGVQVELLTLAVQKNGVENEMLGTLKGLQVLLEAIPQQAADEPAIDPAGFQQIDKTFAEKIAARILKRKA